MTSVMGHTAYTGVYCQYEHTALECGIQRCTKICVRPGKWKLGERKNRGLELYDMCLEVPCSCGKGNATQSLVLQDLWVQQ